MVICPSGDAKRPKGALHDHEFTDSDDDVNVFEMINTEKARLAKAAKIETENRKTRLNVDLKSTAEAVTKKASRIGRMKSAPETLPEPELPKSEPLNGRKNSSPVEKKTDPKTALNGTNKKIILKRTSNGSNSDDDVELKVIYL